MSAIETLRARLAALLRPRGGAHPATPAAVAPSRGYALCGAPRSGSNYFCEILGSTGQLGHPREYFNAAARRAVDGTDDYPEDRAGQIARILSQGATPNGVYGLKLFPGLFEAVAGEVRLSQVLPALRFVRLQRRDALGQAISWVRANQTAQHRSTEAVRGEPVYDGDAIGAYLAQVCQRAARWDMYFARTGIEPVEVVYEDLVDDPQAAVDRVAAAMGVDPAPRVAFDRLRLKMQRDAVSDAWRARFHAEHGDPSRIDPTDAMTRTL